VGRPDRPRIPPVARRIRLTIPCLPRFSPSPPGARLPAGSDSARLGHLPGSRHGRHVVHSAHCHGVRLSRHAIGPLCWAVSRPDPPGPGRAFAGSRFRGACAGLVKPGYGMGKTSCMTGVTRCPVLAQMARLRLRSSLAMIVTIPMTRAGRTRSPHCMDLDTQVHTVRRRVSGGGYQGRGRSADHHVGQCCSVWCGGGAACVPGWGVTRTGVSTSAITALLSVGGAAATTLTIKEGGVHKKMRRISSSDSAHLVQI
jgi:hypothetical protein